LGKRKAYGKRTNRDCHMGYDLRINYMPLLVHAT
jgi:hypothetical protein